MGRGAFLGAIAIVLAGCEIWEPIGAFSYAEIAGEDAGADAWTSPDAPMAGDVGVEDGAADAGLDAADGDGRVNPCPDPTQPCCGWTDEAGPGDLYCDGFKCQSDPETTCKACLAEGCDASAQFCCVPGGDNKPVCVTHGTKCGA
jgi:hypothetical protein